MGDHQIDEVLLSMLRCPACPERPEVRTEGERLVCTVCGRKYPIINGIPVMLVEEAETE